MATDHERSIVRRALHAYRQTTGPDELADAVLTALAEGHLTYEDGFRAGNSDIGADWDIALDDLLPDEVEVQPSQVAAYIRRLQGGALERVGWISEGGLFYNEQQHTSLEHVAARRRRVPVYKVGE